jgi:hypothetical protein
MASDLPHLWAQLQAGHGKRAGRHRVLAVPYVNPVLVRALRDHGIPFAGTAGNLFLDLPGLFAWCSGNRPPAAVRARTQTVGSLSHAALRPTYILLRVPGRCRALTPRPPYSSSWPLVVKVKTPSQSAGGGCLRKSWTRSR